MSDHNNNNNIIYGTPSKKKRNELHDASDIRFQSPHHVTSITGVGATANNNVLGSPEVGAFMSVFMSPMTQYQQTVPDSKDWTPAIQNKLVNEGFLTFPDTGTPGLSLTNHNNQQHPQYQRSHPLSSGLRTHGIQQSHSNQSQSQSHHIHSSSNTNSNMRTASLLSQNDPALMSPLFPDLLDSQHGDGLGSAASFRQSVLSSNGGTSHSQNGGGLLLQQQQELLSLQQQALNSNHFAQNAEALKNRINKRKSASGAEGIHLSSLEDRHGSLLGDPNATTNNVLFAPPSLALFHQQSQSLHHNSNSNSNNHSSNTSGSGMRLGIADTGNTSNGGNNNVEYLSSSQLSTSSDISGIAAITMAAAFMPPSVNVSPDDKKPSTNGSNSTKNNNNNNNANKRKEKKPAKSTPSKQQAMMNRQSNNMGNLADTRMDEDDEDNQEHLHHHNNSNNNYQYHDEDGEGEDDDERNAAGRSFMSPEMKELSMRATPMTAASSSSKNNNSNNNNSNNNGSIACNCKKSRCLKMYCDCFRLSEYCNTGCNCVECCNIEKFDALRLSARKAIQDRNPEAFKPRVQEAKNEHLTGCHCRKSACLKKYCECYTGKVPCSNRCRCVDCQNVPTLYAKGGSGGVVVLQPANRHTLLPNNATTSSSLNNHMHTTSNNKLFALPAAIHTNTTAKNNDEEEEDDDDDEEDGDDTTYRHNNSHTMNHNSSNHNMNNNSTFSNNNSQSNSAEKEGSLNFSTSPSAAVAALATLSASKVPASGLLLDAVRQQAQPVQLFAEDDNDDDNNNNNHNNNNNNNGNDDDNHHGGNPVHTTSTSTNTSTSANDSSSSSSSSQQNNRNNHDAPLSIDVPSSSSFITTNHHNVITSHNDHVNNNSYFGVTSSPALRELARKSQHGYRDICPAPGMDSAVSHIATFHNNSITNNHNHNNNNTSAATTATAAGVVTGAFSVPHSPIRNNSSSSSAGVMHLASPPKLMELAELCEERQPLREIAFPTSLRLGDEDETNSSSGAHSHATSHGSDTRRVSYMRDSRESGSESGDHA